ncbi:MAG TPA: DUF2232 domain-containing protein [Candidatus Binataceae bacterium]|nr:DUF2232 domain-containing protein [Candidatus Binataceae bacterium]
MARAAFASAVMFLAGAVVPVVGGAAMVFAPAPVLGYSVGFPHALARMAVVVAVSALLVSLVAGFPAAAAYLVTFGIAAAVMCYMLERRQPFELIVLCATATILVAGSLGALAFAGSPSALAQQLHHELIAGMVRGEKFYKTLGIEAAVSADTRTTIVEAIVKLTPALVALFSAVTILLNLAIFWRLSGKQRRLGYTLFGDLVRWSAPEWLIWLLLVAGFGLFISLAPLGTIALDCFICVAAVYFCQGLAIMAFYFKLLGMPPLARGLIYFVTVVQPVLAVLVCVAGIFDLWIDFRRLKPPSEEARNLGNFL